MEEYRDEQKEVIAEQTEDSVKKVKHKYCLAPCPEYDITGTEQWLEEMAEQGYLLEKDGQWLGWFDFVKGERKKVRYRLQVAEYNDEPDEEAIELSEKYGWEYVTRRGNIYIWRTEDREARELNTDPAVQAMTLNLLGKQQKSAIIDAVLSAILYPFLVLRGLVFLAMMYLKTWVVLLAAFDFGWCLVHSVRKATKLGRMRKQLLLGEAPEAVYDWKNRGKWYQLSKLFRSGLTIVSVALLIYSYVSLEFGYASLERFAKEVPFATMEDFLPGGNVEDTNFFAVSEAKGWEDILSPVNYLWKEVETVKNPEGRTISGILDIFYHEMRFPWMAKWVAKEYRRFDRTSGYQNWKAYTELEPGVEFPELDYFAVYETDEPYTIAVMVKGNIVIRVSFMQTGTEEKMPLKEWLRIVAEAM